MPGLVFPINDTDRTHAAFPLLNRDIRSFVKGSLIYVEYRYRGASQIFCAKPRGTTLK